MGRSSATEGCLKEAKDVPSEAKARLDLASYARVEARTLQKSSSHVGSEACIYLLDKVWPTPAGLVLMSASRMKAVRFPFPPAARA